MSKFHLIDFPNIQNISNGEREGVNRLTQILIIIGNVDEWTCPHMYFGAYS